MGEMLMSKRRGIRRHETLKPLSRHHMEGLHLALKLKQAGMKESKLSEVEIIQDAHEFWEPGGQSHFREEEEILLPAYAEYEDIDHPTVVQMLLEHVWIRSYMTRLLGKESMYASEMQKFGALLESHIRDEERTIFPMIEKALPEEKLIELAPYFH